LSWLYIDFLSDDTIDIPDDPPSLDELISRSDTVDDELGILAIVVIPHSTPSTVVGEVSGDE
jgi:hypothetical protein